MKEKFSIDLGGELHAASCHRQDVSCSLLHVHESVACSNRKRGDSVSAIVNLRKVQHWLGVLIRKS